MRHHAARQRVNRARAPRRTQVYVERRPQPSSAGGGLPPFNWPAALSWTRSSPRRRLPTGDRLGVEPRERRSARAASARPMCGVGLSRCAGLQPTASAPRWRPRPLATHFRATCSPRIGWPELRAAPHTRPAHNGYPLRLTLCISSRLFPPIFAMGMPIDGRSIDPKLKFSGQASFSQPLLTTP